MARKSKAQRQQELAERMKETGARIDPIDFAAPQGDPIAGDLVAKEFEEDPPPTINKIPTNGMKAYEDGFTAADCPFEEGTNEFDKWNEQFDEAADNAEEAEKEEEPQPKSVVKSKYRAIYAENGTPTTCGDDLALKLNALLKNDGGTNIELLDEICRLNDVSLEKYNRTSHGWQGRLRMTARNMLAKKARDNGGTLALPEMLGGVMKLIA